MKDQTLNVTGLTLEQIEQIKAIIEEFHAKNKLIRNETSKEEQSSYTVNDEDVNMNYLFFASEILAPFDRIMLYNQVNKIYTFNVNDFIWCSDIEVIEPR
jgi:uncharacterized protein YcaQ